MGVYTPGGQRPWRIYFFDYLFIWFSIIAINQSMVWAGDAARQAGTIGEHLAALDQWNAPKVRAPGDMPAEVDALAGAHAEVEAPCGTEMGADAPGLLPVAKWGLMPPFIGPAPWLDARVDNWVDASGGIQVDAPGDVGVDVPGGIQAHAPWLDAPVDSGVAAFGGIQASVDDPRAAEARAWDTGSWEEAPCGMQVDASAGSSGLAASGDMQVDASALGGTWVDASVPGGGMQVDASAQVDAVAGSGGPAKTARTRGGHGWRSKRAGSSAASKAWDAWRGNKEWW